MCAGVRTFSFEGWNLCALWHDFCVCSWFHRCIKGLWCPLRQHCFIHVSKFTVTWLMQVSKSIIAALLQLDAGISCD